MLSDVFTDSYRSKYAYKQVNVRILNLIADYTFYFLIYLLVILKLLNVMCRDVVRCLILVHILSHIQHKIRWIMLYIKQIKHKLITIN